jgi:succinate dehydrogenase/fumarate reductase flavoprotein subunit
VECHSANSILMASLYRYQAKERRNELGFVNASILNQSYVIGANRNVFLNILSLVIFGMVIGGIVIHAVLRKVKLKK